MNFRQLACFVAVVDEGSFTRAARRDRDRAALALAAHPRARGRPRRPRDRAPAARGVAHAGRPRAPARGAGRSPRGRARPAGARAALALEAGELEIATVLSMAVGLLPRYIRVWHERHPARRHPPPRVPAPHRCSRTPSSRASPTSRSGRCRFAPWDGPLEAVAWEEFVLVVARPTTRSRRAATSRSRSSPTASGCSTTRTTASPGSSRRSAARAGFSPRGTVRTSQAEGAARLASAGIGPALVPDNIVLPGIEGSRPAARPARSFAMSPSTRARELVADSGGVRRRAPLETRASVRRGSISIEL